MAIGKKTGGRNFVKGQSGNPRGRLPIDPELRAVKEMTPSYVRKVISKFMAMNRDELTVVVKDPKTPMFEVTVASILTKSLQTGDYTRLNFLLERSIGKVKDEIETTNKHTIYATTFQPDGTLIQQIIQEKLHGDDDNTVKKLQPDS
jgi:hypothetical protein